MTDVDTLLARAWLMRNTRPSALATEALVASIGPQEAMAQIQSKQASPAVMWEVVPARGDEAADLEALDSDTYRLVTPESNEWPAQQLAALTAFGKGAPLGLWVYGTGSLAEYVARAVALIGTQEATRSGKETAMRFAIGLGTQGTRVVTGAAQGIERAALLGTTQSPCPPVVVARCGLGRIPKSEPISSARLHRIVQRGGLVISADPVNGSMSSLTYAQHGWLRTALTQATVLVEALGTEPFLPLDTAPAWELKRLFAVPGQVTSSASDGPDALIRAGFARRATEARDVLATINPS